MLFISDCTCVNYEEYHVDDISSGNFKRHDVFTLERQRREVGATTQATAPEASKNTTTTNSTTNTTSNGLTAPAPAIVVPPMNVTGNSTKTSNATDGVAPTGVSVTQTPLLGQNGTGIRKDVDTKVSEPIVPDDTLPDVFNETPERIKAEHHLKNLKVETNGFYNSTFIGNVDYFKEFWTNITKEEPQVHVMLSNSYRRATTISLKFPFPFYGHYIQKVTVATGGFLYIGEHIHNWLAATQYIAPLMGNFDTSQSSDSVVKLYDDGEKFVVFWENVILQEDTSMPFTFAVALYKNGDIVFLYKDMPIDVQKINDTVHPVKVGISDAYLKDHILYRIRSKTVYEYNRVSFKNYEIKSNTIIRMTALPTCLQYNNCYDCLNHETSFNCTWCPQLQKCSSGTDRNKQDWKQRNCPKTSVTNITQCPAEENEPVFNNTAYVTDTDNNTKKTETIIRTVSEVKSDASPSYPEKVPLPSDTKSESRSPVGGVVASFVVITIVCSALAWVFYAFKNPHTKSGQLLIKYRPTQWSWRRGEARYTAATIHM